jgi:hypothetical protein
MLPDDVLLEIFDFCLDTNGLFEAWITLAHVCRRWRSLVFQSPRRLNLRLYCTPETRVEDTLGIWPPLPLIINYFGDDDDDEATGVDNIIAALEHNDRVCQIEFIYLTRSQLGYVTDSAAMKRPFPELTVLHLGIYNGSGPILPDSFLSGTAPRLRSLKLDDVPFPGLPKLLLSAIHLVCLNLDNIPHSGYIPPEAMATSLSALTNLESLFLCFLSPQPRPALDSRHLPPQIRSILPSLTVIRFKGASEYLEVILARIDAPRLKHLHITFNQAIIDTPQLLQFIRRTPTLRAPERGHITFDSKIIFVKFRSQASDYGVIWVEIPCRASEWQLSTLEQICTLSLPPLSTLKDLYIFETRLYPPPRSQDNVENPLWLGLLHSFVGVKNLYLSEGIVPRIAPALQELIGGRTTEVLPTLENIFLKGSQTSIPLHEGIEKFVAARRLTSHPVVVSPLDGDRHWTKFR